MSNYATTRLLAATAIAAVAVSVAAVPANAATAGAQHCSAWKPVASTGYQLKVCGTLAVAKKTTTVKESVTIKNTGKQNVALSGFYGVNWNQAGTGTPISGVKVAPGKSDTIKHTFTVGSGPYTVQAALTVGKNSARVDTTFKK